MNDTKTETAMPDEGAKRFAQIRGGAAMGSRRVGFGCLQLVLVLDLVLGLGDSVAAMLRYDRSAIAAGGWWRLLTAHIVHLDLHHLLLNELGLVLMWALFAGDYDPGRMVRSSSSRRALAISCGTVVAQPACRLVCRCYPGVLHTIMAAGCARHLAARAWDRWILIGCLCGQARL